MSKFSDVDWEPGTPFAVLQDRGFFPYSGEDGDLFRKNGVAGWRVSVYGRSLVKIQQKGRRWRGHQYWNERVRWGEIGGDPLTDEQIAGFAETLDRLIETGSVE